MKVSVFFMLVIVTGCSGKTDHSVLPGTPKMSNAQAFLSDLKDSMISQYHSAGSDKGKQGILDKYLLKLKGYLTQNPMDSVRVTMDKVIINGRTITTKSHYSSIEFEYGLTFNDSMSPRIDSIYEFMKGLKEGSDTVVNFSFTGACQVNNPDSAKLATFRIYAFPFPLQYAGK